MHSFTTVFWYIIIILLYYYLHSLTSATFPLKLVSCQSWLNVCLLVNSLLFSLTRFRFRGSLSDDSSQNQNSVSSQIWLIRFFPNFATFSTMQQIARQRNFLCLCSVFIYLIVFSLFVLKLSTNNFWLKIF